MSDGLRTAAIEAVAQALGAAARDEGGPCQFCYSDAETAVDAVLPLLVAGTASRIADAIEAEAEEARHRQSLNGLRATSNHNGRVKGLTAAAAIARRVGGTS